jgi:hypothetical protein
MNTPRQDLATIEAQLEAEAAKVSAQVGQPEARKISMDRTGNFIAPGGVNLGSEIEIVVVDFCSANDFYTAAFDPNNPKPPVCFARGRELADMYPEDISPEKQAENCSVCPQNQFGSRGNGKACKNTRLLAVVLTNEIDAEEPDETPIYLLSVPPTGLKSFDAAALQTARILNGPPIKAVFTVRAVSGGTYNTMQFSTPSPNPHFAALFQLREKAEDMLGRLPDLTNYVPTRQPNQVRR